MFEDIQIYIVEINKYSHKAEIFWGASAHSTTIAGAIHSSFNFHDGDPYAWPADNITPEQVNAEYEAGKRVFYFENPHTECSINIVPRNTSTKEPDQLQAELKTIANLVDDYIDRNDPELKEQDSRDLSARIDPWY
jgi:hypothetical protein